MKDPLTKEEFEPKRSNQRFASPQNRIKYYNNKANQERKENAFIDKPLKTNLKILKELMEGKSEATFHEEFLIGAKYDINVFNGTCKTSKGTGFCLYNYIINFEKPYVYVYRKNRS